MKGQGIQPDLDVLGCNPHFGPRKLLVVCRVTISLKTRLYKGSLFFTEPADCAGIVGNEPICDDRDQNREKALLYILLV